MLSRYRCGRRQKTFFSVLKIIGNTIYEISRSQNLKISRLPSLMPYR